MDIKNTSDLEEALSYGTPIWVWIGTDGAFTVTTNRLIYIFRITEECARLLLRWQWRREQALAGAIADWLDENRQECLKSCQMLDADSRFSSLVDSMRRYCRTGNYYAY